MYCQSAKCYDGSHCIIQRKYYFLIQYYYSSEYYENKKSIIKSQSIVAAFGALYHWLPFLVYFSSLIRFMHKGSKCQFYGNLTLEYVQSLFIFDRYGFNLTILFWVDNCDLCNLFSHAV